MWSDVKPEFIAVGEQFHICGEGGVKDGMDESFVKVEHEELLFGGCCRLGLIG